MSSPFLILKSQNHWTADGVQTIWNFSFSGGYINRTHVRAYSKNPDGDITDIPLTSANFIGDYQLSITPPVTAGDTLVIYRDSSNDGLPLVDFKDTAIVSEASLDVVAKQGVFMAAESADFLGITTTADLVDLAADSAAAAAAATAAAAAAELSAFSAAASADDATATVAALGAPGGEQLVSYKLNSISGVMRTVGNKLRESYSVLDLGADPTGLTSSVGAIQAAINRCALLSSGPNQTPGIGIYFPVVQHPTLDRYDGTYLIDSDIIVPATLDGLGLFSMPGKGARLVFTNGAKIVVGDVAHALATNRFTMANLLLIGQDVVGSKCLELHRTPDTLIFNCVFWNFDIAIDGYRFNQSHVIGNTFYNTSRNTSSTAFLRLQGVAPGETGGGLHFLDNEMSGNPGDTGMQKTCILAHTVDTMYISNNHFVHYVEGLRCEPLGTPENNVITDIQMFGNNYFDNPHNVGASCVRLTGGVRSGGIYGTGFYQDIGFGGTLFRAAGRADYCLKIDITDLDGSWAAAGRKVQNILLTGCNLRQAQKVAVLARGASAGFLEVYGLTVTGSTFRDHNQDGTAPTSGIQAEVETLTVTGNTFQQDTNPALHNITCNLSLLASNNPGFTCGLNDFSKSNATGDFVQSSDIGGALQTISDNLFPGKGQLIRQMYKASLTQRLPVIMWRQVVASTGQAAQLNMRTSACSSSGPSPAGTERYMTRQRASMYRVAGSDAVVTGQTVETVAGAVTNTFPVTMGLLTGPDWAATTAYAAGAWIKNAGNLYLVCVAGTTSTTPPVHTGVATDGTAVLGYIGPVLLNTFAIVASGAPTGTITEFISLVEWEAVP